MAAAAAAAVDETPLRVRVLEAIPGRRAHVVLYTVPRAKPRPRAMTTRAGRLIVYSPSTAAEAKLRAALSAALRDAGFTQPITESVIVSMKFIFARKGRRTTTPIPPAPPTHAQGSADIDNIMKTYLDVANGVLFADDKQVVSITAAKLSEEVSPADEHPDHTARVVFHVDAAAAV